jgi:hypothetical protein
MPRVYLPLLPIPVLAIVAAFSACGSRSGEPAARVIPEAVALVPAAAAAAPAAPAPQPPAGEDTPSDEEVRAFERPVAK